jgi:hypothetical protein
VVVELLKGDADSLDGDSRLVSDVPEGTILYGAAIELENISRHERPFPVLKQHEHIRLVVGEREGELFKEVTLEARDEETAGQMKETLEGLVALSKLWSAEMENLNALYDDVEIEQEGATVHAKWRGATAETVKGVEQLADHVKHWRKSKRAGR